MENLTDFSLSKMLSQISKVSQEGQVRKIRGGGSYGHNT